MRTQGAAVPVRPRAMALMLFCRARARLCAFPLEHLEETMRPLPVEPLSGAPRFVLGLSVIRGAPAPVIDAGALVGEAAPPAPARFVTLKAGTRRVALAVETVIGIRELGPASLHDLPPLLREAGAGVVATIGSLDGELLLVLDRARLVPQSVWETLESGEVA